MRRHATWLVLVGILGCSGGGNDRPDAPGGGGDDAPEQMIDAAIDSAPDAPPDGPTLAPHLKAVPDTVTLTGGVTRASQDQLVEIDNDGTADATGIAVALAAGSPGFSITSNTCGTTLAIGASCFVNVRFAPLDRGTVVTSLDVASAAGALAVPFTAGAIRAATFEITLAADPLPQVGVAATKTVGVTVKNTGDLASGSTTLNLAAADSGISLLSGNCTSPLAAGGTCNGTLTINPPSLGTLRAVIRATGVSAGETLLPVAVEAVAAAQLAVGPVASFGQVPIGTTADRTWTFANTGGAPTGTLAITLTTSLPVAIISDGCTGTSLAGGATCSVTARFTPSSSAASTIDVKATATPGNIANRTVDGRAVTPTALSFTGAAATFGDTEVGQTPYRTFKVLNSGEAASGTLSVTLTGAAFSVLAQDCNGTSLQQNQTCFITVKFTPAATGAASGMLSLTGSTGLPTPLSLSGNGVSPSGLQVDVVAGDAGRVLVGATAPLTLVITNKNPSVSSGALSRTVSGNTTQFTVPTTCDGVNLAPNGTCTLTVTYAPTATGTHSITLGYTSSALNSISSVLSGTAYDQGTVTVASAGGGTVTGTGITCGTDCTTTGTVGASLALTATPATGYSFSGWTGCTTSTGTSCSVTIAKVSNVTASFSPVPNTLSVTVTTIGNATGTVTAPTLINCGDGNTSCMSGVNPTNTVTLTATPGPGYGFGGWSGACTGFEFTCTVSMSAARSVGATFSPLNRMFTSALTFTPGGGIASADAQCATDAFNGGFEGTFFAVIAQAGSYPFERMTGRGFVNTSAFPQVVGDQVTELAYGQLRAVVGYTTGGARMYDVKNWAGQLANTCSSWTSTSATDVVTNGITNSTGAQWYVGELANCSVSAHLICTQNDYHARPITPTPAPSDKYAFVTAFRTQPDAGIAGFDALCASEASTYNLPAGTYVALVSTPQAAASTRLASNATYRRLDGALIGTTADILANPRLMSAGINEASGKFYLAISSVYTGGTFTTASTAADTCNGWTTADPAARGVIGFAGDTDTTFFNGYRTSCDSLWPIYCVEQ